MSLTFLECMNNKIMDNNNPSFNLNAKNCYGHSFALRVLFDLHVYLPGAF